MLGHLRGELLLQPLEPCLEILYGPSGHGNLDIQIALAELRQDILGTDVVTCGNRDFVNASVIFALHGGHLLIRQNNYAVPAGLYRYRAEYSPQTTRRDTKKQTNQRETVSTRNQRNPHIQVVLYSPDSLFLGTLFASLVHHASQTLVVPPLAPELVARVVEMTLGAAPGEATHWTGRAMAEAAGISLRSVQRIWAAHGLKPHRLETFKLSRDPDFVATMHDIIGLYLDPPEHALVLAVDEKSQIQALDRTQPGLPMKKVRSGTMTHDYKRHGTTTLFAALDVPTDPPEPWFFAGLKIMPQLGELATPMGHVSPHPTIPPSVSTATIVLSTISGVFAPDTLAPPPGMGRLT